MNKRVLEILRLYLSGDIDFDSLEDQVVFLAFEADDQDGQLAYEVLAEIAYVTDKVSDESTFKTRIAETVTRQRTGVRTVSG